MGIVTKWAGTGEYLIWFTLGTDRLQWRVRNVADTVVGNATANTLGAPAINTWYCIVSWHDSVANTINISINNGGVDSTVWAGGVRDSTTAFEISGYNGGADAFNGRTGPTMFWKSAAGGGGVLTAAQRSALYNGGAGLPYASFTL
jgi:hypothetical protein